MNAQEQEQILNRLDMYNTDRQTDTDREVNNRLPIQENNPSLAQRLSAVEESQRMVVDQLKTTAKQLERKFEWLEKKVNQNNNTIKFTWLFFCTVVVLLIAVCLMMNSRGLSHEHVQQMLEEFTSKECSQFSCKSAEAQSFVMDECLGVKEKEDKAIAGVRATIALSLNRLESCHLLPLSNSIQCSFEPESSKEKTQLDCTLKKSEDGEYEIIYLPKVISSGLHKLSIEVGGKNISGSPVTIFVRQNIVNQPVKVINVTSPQGMTFNVRGEVIVAEYKEHQVSIFDPETDEKSKLFIGSKGLSEERVQFKHPCDVAVDDEGRILVADGKNHRIQVFSSDGKFIASKGEQGTDNLQFGFPTGIEIHPYTKRIYVAEGKNHRVQILNPWPDMTFHGNLSGEFNEPKDVAFDSQGRVYVADNENHQIQVFTAEGKYLRRFGKEGKEEGQIIYPTGISIDKNDIVYVTELYNYRVSLFTLKGKFLTSFGEKGSKLGQFHDPRGIAVDKEGKIYVSDYGNDRIQVFK